MNYAILKSAIGRPSAFWPICKCCCRSATASDRAAAFDVADGNLLGGAAVVALENNVVVAAIAQYPSKIYAAFTAPAQPDVTFSPEVDFQAHLHGCLSGHGGGPSSSYHNAVGLFGGQLQTRGHSGRCKELED
jgi:hypothetical protein